MKPACPHGVNRIPGKKIPAKKNAAPPPFPENKKPRKERRTWKFSPARKNIFVFFK